MKTTLLFLFTITLAINGLGQTGGDSTHQVPDTTRKPRAATIRKRIVPVIRDTVAVAARHIEPVVKRKEVPQPSYYSVVRENPYFNFSGKPVAQTYSTRQTQGKDALFYLMIALLLYFALVRLMFAKYMNNFFTLIFRASLKQKQIREQLLQTPLPSLLLNIQFLITGGIYISFLLRYYHFVQETSLAWLTLYSSLALALIYSGKFVVLKFLGWIFNIEEATDMYIFIVFLVNKLLGICLIPFIILLAFSSSPDIWITVSLLMVLIAFAYRYIISFAPIRKQINVSQLHFFLYLCGFEIIPLLVIYKLLLTFLERSI